MRLPHKQLLEICHYINENGQVHMEHSDTPHWAEHPEFESLRDNEQLRKALIMALHYECQIEDIPNNMAQFRHIARDGGKMVFDEPSHKVLRIVNSRNDAFEDYEFLRRMIDAEREMLQITPVIVNFL